MQMILGDMVKDTMNASFELSTRARTGVLSVPRLSADISLIYFYNTTQDGFDWSSIHRKTDTWTNRAVKH
jgi:hypothetical protein